MGLYGDSLSKDVSASVIVKEKEYGWKESIPLQCGVTGILAKVVIGN